MNFSVLGEAAGCENPNLTPTYLDNIARLGLIELPDAHYTAPGAYDELENHPSVVEAKKQIDAVEGHRSLIEKRMVNVTQLGQQFIKACVTDHRKLALPIIVSCMVVRRKMKMGSMAFRITD